MIPRILLFILCSGFVISAQAQIKYTVTQFTAEDGLVSTEISSLFQDSRHYVWIGHTGGVSRYDGYRFEDFLYTPKRQLGKTWCIAEDDDHHIWIGTENGLFLFNKDTLRYITFDAKPSAVYALAFDVRGGLWIGTNEGPSYIAKEILQKTVVSYRLAMHQNILPAWKEKYPAPNPVVEISTAKDGAVYLGDGYCVLKYWKDILSFVWESKDRTDQLHDLFAVDKDTVYLCSGSRGIQIVENNVPRQSQTKTGRGIGLAERNGQLFFYATEGLYAVNKATLECSLLIKLPAEMIAWGSCAMQDKESNFWIGTHEQLSYVRRNFFTAVHQPALEGFNELYSIEQLQDGTLLCGGNHGVIFRAEKGSHVFTPWKKVFTKAHVSDIIQDKNGGIWFSSGFQGITVLDKDKSYLYTKKEGLRDNTNFVFITTPRGERFAAGDDGVSQIIQDMDGRLRFKNYRFSSVNTNYAVIKRGIPIPGGGLLLGSNHGLLVLQNDTLLPAVINNAPHRIYNVTDIRQDRAGHIWISTIGDGILIADFGKDNTLTIRHRLTKQNGLPALIYLQLLIDRNNIVWAAGYNGITRIEPTSGNEFFISTFCKQQGFLPASFHNVTMMQDVTGRIWIATTSGLLYFDPAAIDHLPMPSLQLHDINLLQHDQDHAQQVKQLPDGIHLNHRSNSIAFGFTGLYFSDPGAVTYTYRLLGFDSLWTDAGRNRQVSFRHLPPGHYTFQVKAAAGTNRWSDAVSWHFVITPPFWKRWWFIVLCTFAVTTIVYLIIKRRISIIQQRGEERAAVQQLVSDNLQYRLEIQQVINYFAASLAGKQTIDDILWDVARNCISRLGFEDCVIYLVDEKRNMLVQKAAWGPKTDLQNRIVNPIEITLGQGIVGHVALTGKPEIVHDTETDNRYIVDDQQRFSEIAVPILEEGKVIGIIDSEHSQKHFYTDRHMQILTTIASLCADKLVVTKADMKRQQAQLEALYNKQKATEALLQSMRLQMSPHFLFNALNSIQQMILAGDETIATRALSKFAKLLRLVLIHSDKDKITLREELQILTLYIDLESFRFTDRFKYAITCDAAIDQDETKVPALLIQPFVENAIWHGLMHKEGQRLLQVHFAEETNGTLVCIIEDNGIGRQASWSGKSTPGYKNKHTGKGIAVATERLKVFNEHSGLGNSLEITDLTDMQGHASGTKVIVKFIP